MMDLTEIHQERCYLGAEENGVAKIQRFDGSTIRSVQEIHLYPNMGVSWRSPWESENCALTILADWLDDSRIMYAIELAPKFAGVIFHPRRHILYLPEVDVQVWVLRNLG